MAKITKDTPFEEARNSVLGTRTMLVMKFKPLLEEAFTVDDLFAVADEGIVRAYKDWDPTRSKFNTFAYNHMSWAINDFMNAVNSRFKINGLTTYELTREGQSFKEVKEAGKTANEDFNKSYSDSFDLDGSDEAKARINRDVYNAYIAFESSIRRPFYVINESSFQSDDSEDFNILDTAEACEDYGQNFEWDSFSMPKDEMEDAMAALDEDKRKVAQMILDGANVSEMAKEFRLSQNQFMQKFAGESSGSKGKAKSKRTNQETLDFLAKQRAKKAAMMA